MFPFFGDLAKAGKLGSYAKKLGKLIDFASKNEKAAEALKPLLKKFDDFFQRIPLDNLTDELRKPLEGIKRKLDNLFRRSADLQPYGGTGGGHHVPAKGGLIGAAGYDAKKALAIPNEELKKFGVVHSAVTGAQSSLYRGFSKTGRKLTWDAVERIETEALIRGGMPADVARATVRKAIDSLKDSGVSGPKRIPWGGK